MDNDMVERKVDCNYISRTGAEKEYFVVAVVEGVDQVEDRETGVVGLDGN